MQDKEDKLYIFSFYRFIKVNNKKIIKIKLDRFLKNKSVLGTVLLADEGINGTISGKEYELVLIINFIRKLLSIRKLEIKKNEVNFLPFNRLKIRLKKEIVTLGKGIFSDLNDKGKFVEPYKWNDFIKQKNLCLIDLRNNYEVKIGAFKDAVNPNTKNFRDFPSKFEKMSINKDITIAMYCTGGIRCEKASGYLNKIGYKNVYQLKGGILNYLSEVKKNNYRSSWNGECFVFDGRVTVNKNLKKGKYYQCYGCRMPITHNEKNSTLYIKGVQCPKCFNTRTTNQKARSATRQKQIDLAEKSKISHPFQKITVVNSQ